MKLSETIQFERARFMSIIRAGLHIGAKQTHIVPEGMGIEPIDLKADTRLLSARIRVLENYLCATKAVTRDELEIELNRALEREVEALEQELTDELKFKVNLR